MLHMTVLLEDCTLVATINCQPPKENELPEIDSHWTFVCQDNLTGKTETGKWTSVQLAAVLALATAGDDFPEDISKELYKIAEPLVEDWPQEIRPIP